VEVGDLGVSVPVGIGKKILSIFFFLPYMGQFKILRYLQRVVDGASAVRGLRASVRKCRI